MVLSKINTDINYLETNTIDDNDLDQEAFIYKGYLHKKNIEFVLGKPNFEYIDNDVVYFNIYLVNKNTVLSKIGIYEAANSNYITLLDSAGDIDLSKINSPLIFSFTKALIAKYKLDISDKEIQKIDNKDEDEDEDSEDSENEDNEGEGTEDEDSEDKDSEDEDSEDEDEDEDSEDKDKEEDEKDTEVAPELIQEQTKEESDIEIQNYSEKIDDKWINKYLKSSKYNIQDNEGGGDCFFAVLRDALKSVNIIVSVKSIRERLALEADEEVYNTYKSFFDTYYEGLKISLQSIAKIKDTHKSLKAFISGTTNLTDKMKFTEDAKTNLTKLKIESDKKQEFEHLIDETSFMKDVKSLQDLQKVIKTNQFWADAWAVSTIERIYNVKFIILSKKHFLENEIDNVMQCGDVDKIIQEKGIFEPKYYIIADYIMDEHYKLITYDKNINKAVFNFKELPYRIKEIILEKCLEKCSGIYSLIPDFKNLANCNNIKIESDRKDDKSLLPKIASQLYNDSIIIQIYNRSRDEKVGNGTGESILPELKTNKNVIELNKKKLYPDWRKKLDEDYICKTLIIDGNNWSSVKHYILANRFSNITEIYNKFLKDSEVGNNLEAAQKLYDKTLKDKKIISRLISNDEYESNLSKLYEKANYQKFTQDSDLKEILLLTDTFLINIYKPKKGITPATELMKVRQLLGK